MVFFVCVVTVCMRFRNFEFVSLCPYSSRCFMRYASTVSTCDIGVLLWYLEAISKALELMKRVKSTSKTSMNTSHKILPFPPEGSQVHFNRTINEPSIYEHLMKQFQPWCCPRFTKLTCSAAFGRRWYSNNSALLPSDDGILMIFWIIWSLSTSSKAEKAIAAS